LYLRDLRTGTLSLVSLGDDGQPADAQAFVSQLSGDGDHLVYFSQAKNLPGGAAGALYERTLSTGTTAIVGAADGSAARAGGAQTPLTSADGSCVVFSDDTAGLAPNVFGGPQLVQVYLRTVRRECPLVAPDTTITSGPPATIHTPSATFAFNATYA